jgi:hypothetical protein
MGYETIKTELNKKENVSDSPFTVSFLSGAMSGMVIYINFMIIAIY